MHKAKRLVRQRGNAASHWLRSRLQLLPMEGFLDARSASATLQYAAGYGQPFVTYVRRSRARPWADAGTRTRTTDIHVRRSFVEQLARANTFCARTMWK